MKLIIEIPKGEYDKICKTMLHTSSDNPNFYFESKIANGTPIPDNATNGDVIKVMFPSGKIWKSDSYMCLLIYGQGDAQMIDVDWWNAPYQKGGKE